MEIVRRRELEELASIQSGACVSIYLPVHPAYPETKADPILFRNLVDQAEQQLLQGPMRSSEVREFLKPAHHLQSDDNLWRSSGAQGLAVFLADNVFRHHWLPYSCHQTVDVVESFYLTPLTHSLLESARFHLLALSPKRVQLFRGDSQGMAPVTLSDKVPLSEAAVAREVETEFETSMQYHTSSGFGPTGSLRGTPHGHGDPQDDREVMLKEFLQTVARELDPLLRQENLPLFVAAVEASHPIFRKVCDYPLLQEEGVIGSAEELNEQELFAHVLPLAKSWSNRNLTEHRMRYDQWRGTERASDDLATIVAAAHQGRVNALFSALGERRWGTYDPATERAEAHPESETGDVDLSDLAVKQSLTHGSDVFVVSTEEVPDGGSLVATFRW